jgi:hypothetical protein
MKSKAASTEMEKFAPFVGVWETQGEMRVGPSGQSMKFTASDSYEWIAGGHFLLHRFVADMPDGRNEGIEVIGHDRNNNSYPMRSFDSSGNSSLMQAQLENDTWTFVGETTRFTGGFRDNGKIFAGLWEMREGENKGWQPWMDVTLRKAG